MRTNSLAFNGGTIRGQSRTHNMDADLRHDCGEIGQPNDACRATTNISHPLVSNLPGLVSGYEFLGQTSMREQSVQVTAGYCPAGWSWQSQGQAGRRARQFRRRFSIVGTLHRRQAKAMFGRLVKRGGVRMVRTVAPGARRALWGRRLA